MTIIEIEKCTWDMFHLHTEMFYAKKKNPEIISYVYF